MSRPTRGPRRLYPYGTVTRYGPTFQTVPVIPTWPLAWSAFARHYLRSLMLMSFPPGTEMFQFPGFASLSLWIQDEDTWLASPLISPRG